MKRICVYCGSNAGFHDDYKIAAVELADVLVNNDLELVYGGASVGIMGVIADRVLQRGGKVRGVIPEFLAAKEIAHTGLTELHIVSSMHKRKSMMESLSDGFVAMPGGLGTLEELAEMLTWGQLKFHEKPVGLLNTRNYFQHLLGYLDHAMAEGFLRPENHALLLHDADPAALLRKFEDVAPTNPRRETRKNT